MSIKRNIILSAVILSAIILPLSFNVNADEELINIDNVVSNWTFDEGTGSKAYNTILGPDLNLGESPETNPIWEDGIRGSCLMFDGEDDIAYGEELEIPTDGFSLSMWLNCSVNSTGGVPFSYSTIYEENEILIEDPSSLRIHIRGLPKSTDISIDDGKWHHLLIAWKMSDGELSVYVDGSMEYDGTVSVGSGIRSGGSIVLGNDQDGILSGYDPGQAFKGMIDEILMIDHDVDRDMAISIKNADLPLPEIISHSPTGEDIDPDTNISFSFSMSMNHPSVEARLNITPMVNGSFIWKNNTMTFIPDNPMDGGIRYQVILEEGTVDIHERSINRETRFEFTTMASKDNSEDDDDDDTNGAVTHMEDEDDEIGREDYINLAIMLGGAVLIILILTGIFAFISRKNEE